MNNKTKNILYLSILLVFLKWVLIWYLNINQNFIATVINNVEDWQYFTLIHNLSSLNFSPVFDENIIERKNLAFPVYSILFHAISFKFFNVYGFILIELLSIFIFIILLEKILKRINLDFNSSIFLILLIFCLPNIIQFFNLSNILYLNSIDDLYSLRIPRPLITNLYVFFFLYILITTKNIYQFNLKKLAIIGSLFAFMWGSFYFNLAISGVIFLLYYLSIIKKKNKLFTKIFKDFTYIALFFLLFSIPIIIIIFLNVEPDYVRRVGLITLNIEKKKILLEHFILRIIDVKFLIFFTLISLCFYFLKKKSFYDKNSINLFYIIFISSFIAPIIFIIFSPKISEIFHFSNTIISLSFFVMLIYTFLIFNLYIDDFAYKKNFINFSIFLLIIFFSFSNFVKLKKEINNDLGEALNFFKNVSFDKKTQILTFDGKIQTGLILNDFEKFSFVLGVFTSQNDNIIENKVIDSFRFLKLNKSDFLDFIKNEKKGWRFMNKNIGSTFYMKYQANKLLTFNNSMDFSDEELKYISKSSPLHSQQLIMPKFEINRLVQKFLNKKENNLVPEIIVINKGDFFSKNINIDMNLYCHKIINETYEIYYYKDLNQKCLI